MNKLIVNKNKYKYLLELFEVRTRRDVNKLNYLLVKLYLKIDKISVNK